MITDHAAVTARLAGSPLPVLSARRFDLRPLRTSDAGLVGLYAGDIRVASMTTSIPHPLPPGAAEAFVARAMAADPFGQAPAPGQSPHEAVWALDGSRMGLGELLGLISLKAPQGTAEIGYWVAPLLWNAGYATEAVETLLAANPLGLETVRASVFQTNPISARVLVRAGFRYTGDAEAFSVAQNRTVPTWTYLKSLTPGTQ